MHVFLNSSSSLCSSSGLDVNESILASLTSRGSSVSFCDTQGGASFSCSVLRRSICCSASLQRMLQALFVPYSSVRAYSPVPLGIVREFNPSPWVWATGPNTSTTCRRGSTHVIGVTMGFLHCSSNMNSSSILVN